MFLRTPSSDQFGCMPDNPTLFAGSPGRNLTVRGARTRPGALPRIEAQFAPLVSPRQSFAQINIASSVPIGSRRRRGLKAPPRLRWRGVSLGIERRPRPREKRPTRSV